MTLLMFLFGRAFVVVSDSETFVGYANMAAASTSGTESGCLAYPKPLLGGVTEEC